MQQQQRRGAGVETRARAWTTAAVAVVVVLGRGRCDWLGLTRWASDDAAAADPLQIGQGREGHSFPPRGTVLP